MKVRGVCRFTPNPKPQTLYKPKNPKPLKAERLPRAASHRREAARFHAGADAEIAMPRRLSATVASGPRRVGSTASMVSGRRELSEISDPIRRTRQLANRGLGLPLTHQNPLFVGSLQGRYQESRYWWVKVGFRV